MASVLVAETKYGDVVYGSAVACLEERLNSGRYYYEPAEIEAAKTARDEGETTAEAFLQSRKGYEYEYIEWQQVR